MQVLIEVNNSKKQSLLEVVTRAVNSMDKLDRDYINSIVYSNNSTPFNELSMVTEGGSIKFSTNKLISHLIN